jgi:hypothetical protein
MSPATTTFVLVPISVHRPPRIVANDNGISNFEAGTWTFLAHSMTAGNSAATSGVLFMNADIEAIGIIMRSCATATVFGTPNTRCAIQPMTPVSRSAATTT